jgi:hypothetical protein
MQKKPGEVWFLPPQAEEGGDDKPRRHVLLTSLDEDEGGVFAYASTQRTEAAFGATYLPIDPAVAAGHGTGFTKLTRVYPSRLVPAAAEDFLRMTGRINEEMPRLRVLLREALGIGTGTALDGTSGASWRGMVVRLSLVRRRSTGYEFGIVLTEHRYSARRRYQIIVPMENLAEFQPVKGDVVIADQVWCRTVSPVMAGAILAVGDIQSVFHQTDIESWTGATIEGSQLAELEAAIMRMFALP